MRRKTSSLAEAMHSLHLLAMLQKLVRCTTRLQTFCSCQPGTCQVSCTPLDSAPLTEAWYLATGTACTHASPTCPHAAACPQRVHHTPLTLCQRSRSARLLPVLQHLREHMALERLLVLDHQLGVRALEHRRARRARRPARRALDSSARRKSSVGVAACACKGAAQSGLVEAKLCQTCMSLLDIIFELKPVC